MQHRSTNKNLFNISSPYSLPEIKRRVLGRFNSQCPTGPGEDDDNNDGGGETEDPKDPVDPVTPPTPEDKNKEQKPKPPQFTPEQQAHIDKLIGDARLKGRDKGKTEAEQAAEIARSVAEEEVKKKAGEWQGLYTTVGEQRDKLQVEINTKYLPQEQELNSLRETVKASIKAETKDWPEEVLEMMPDEETTSVSELQKWVTKSRKLAKSLAKGAPHTGGGGTNNGGSTGSSYDRAMKGINAGYAIPGQKK